MLPCIRVLKQSYLSVYFNSFNQSSYVNNSHINEQSEFILIVQQTTKQIVSLSPVVSIETRVTQL